jgi:hypothetical protein
MSVAKIKAPFANNSRATPSPMPEDAPTESQDISCFYCDIILDRKVQLRN